MAQTKINIETADMMADALRGDDRPVRPENLRWWDDASYAAHQADGGERPCDCGKFVAHDDYYDCANCGGI